MDQRATSVGRAIGPIVIAAALGLAPTALAGCGSGDDPAAAGAGSLAAALAEVSSNSDEPTTFAWVETARLREIAGLPNSTEGVFGDESLANWQRIASLAVGAELGNQPQLDLGFDPLAGDRTIAVGAPPDDAIRFDGVDTGAAESAFGDLGYESTQGESGEFLALGEEGELDPSVLDEFGNGPIGLNRVAVEGDDLALGGFEEPVASILGRSGEPLGDDPGFAAMAQCLGDDAFAAQITGAAEILATEVSSAGVAVLDPGTEDPGPLEEVICATGEAGGSLSETADAMRAALNEGGTDPLSGQSFEDELGEATIEEGDADGIPYVRATVTPPEKQAVGVTFDLLAQSGITGVFDRGQAALGPDGPDPLTP